MSIGRLSEYDAPWCECSGAVPSATPMQRGRERDTERKESMEKESIKKRRKHGERQADK